MSRFELVAKVEDLGENEVFVTTIGGREIAIFHCAGDYHAVENSCPHRGGPIAEGEFNNGIVTCPWHAWPFEIRSGECTINRAAKLKTYEVRVKDGLITVGVE